MLTPRAVEVTTPPAARDARPAARTPRAPRARRGAVYVAYRRRTATGAGRVATGLAEPAARPGR
jgi:hypothetical protein